MEQRVSVITLGVDDLEYSRRFYEALGWETRAEPGADVVFFQAGGLIVSLWDRTKLAEDSGVDDDGRFGGVTLAQNVVLARRGRPGHQPRRGGRRRYHAPPRRHVLGRLLGLLRRPRRPPLGSRLQPALDAARTTAPSACL